jgi:hypothetical protein
MNAFRAANPAARRVAATGAAPAAREDRVLELGWKCDPRDDALGPEAIVYTRYRDAQRREDAIVSYILIARY